MRYITQLKKKRFKERVGIDHFLQLWFNYHFLFFHSLILRGLKLRAFSLLVQIKMQLKLNQLFDPAFVFLICMLRITPALMLKTIRVGGTNYLVPFPIGYWKKIMIGCSWVIKLIKEHFRAVHVETAADSLLSSLYGMGVSFEKKKNVYFLAGLNRHLLKRKVFKR